MTCRSCGRDGPDGMFCTMCGADQRLAPERTTGSRARRARFAAHPEEAVSHPGLLTTLLPHLDHDRVDEFRWALLGGGAVIFVLYLTGFITAALLVAAALMPLLYVLYVYEVRTYRDAPAAIFGLTIGAGVAVGAVVTFLGNLLRPALSTVDRSPFDASIDVGALLVTGLAIPVVQELAKPIPALMLRRRHEFGQTIDGFVFGVAAGLGFALAQTVVQFAGVFSALAAQSEPGGWAFPLVTFGVLLPVLHGSTTGIITGSLWKRRDRYGAADIVVSLIAAVVFATGSQLIGAFGGGQAIVLAWQAIVVACVLLYARRLLHGALMDEAEAFGMRRLTCPNCHEDITASAFCTVCGMALSASSGSARSAQPATTAATGAPH